MFLLKVLSALLLLASVQAEMNITIDDTDPRILYQPTDVWSFQGNTADTQDRMNKTTHYTSKVGAIASLTFTGAVYVYYVGCPIASMSPPALIPTTLQPWHGSAITVESDAYRPLGSPVQIILFSSNRLDPTETYTITVSKTNATLNSDVNIDAFILTQPDGSDSTTFSSGTNTIEFTSMSAPNTPLPSFVAQTTVISGTTYSGTVVTLGIPGATSSGYLAQTSSATNSHSTNASTNAGAIAGGVAGGIAVGIAIMFFVTRWWSRRNQRKCRLGGLPIQQFSDKALRPVYFNATASTDSSMNSGASPQGSLSAVTDSHSVPSTLVRVPPLTLASIAPGQSSVKARYTGNSQPNNLPSASSSPAPVVTPPDDTAYSESLLPAYSQH